MTSTLQACPECKARLSPNALHCWLCNATLPRAKSEASPTVPRVSNPFGEKAAGPQYRYNYSATLGQLFAILAIVPATGIAFFTTCTALLVAGDKVPNSLDEGRSIAYLVVSGISAAVVFAGFCMLIVSLGKKTVYRVE